MTKLNLGHCYTTRGVADLLTIAEVEGLLRRHEWGDWGEIPAEDRQENELSIKYGWRVMSVYPVGGRKIWIITEADRMTTTVLLPSEY
jgi:hypothetical protein